MTRAGVPDGIVVTRHASAQLARRDPEFAKSSRSLIAAMYQEVAQALAAGRKAAHKPRWVRQTPGRLSRRSEGVRAARYVWDENERRCYVLRNKLRANSTNRRAWLVVTVFVRRDDK